MQIQNSYSAAIALEGQQTALGGNKGMGNFADALNKAAADQTQTIEEKMRQEAADRAEKAQQVSKEVSKAFQDYMSKPLAVHMREAILKEMGLSEEEIKQMPPEKQQAIEAEISRRIRERMLGRKTETPESELVAQRRQLQELIGQAQAAREASGEGEAAILGAKQSSLS